MNDINYSLRPAKNIERKLICELMRKLEKFGLLSEYQYIGFGAHYFNDFRLFYRELGIREMTSIEQSSNQARYRFNAPFSNIKFEFGQSSSALTKCRFDQRAVVWLDYTCRLNEGVFADVKYVLTKAVVGSLLIITVNADSLAKEADSIKKLKEDVGEFRVDASLKPAGLTGWGTSDVYQRIFLQEAQRVVDTLNSGGTAARKIFKQIAYFRYSDNAKMATFAGVLIDEGQKSIFNSCDFEDLDWYCPGAESFHIEVPMLTTKEVQFLNYCVHLDAGDDKFKDSGVSQADFEKFKRMHRYYPVFMESEL